MPLADNTIANVADRLAKRMSDVETRTLTMIASRIRAIGEILPSDASRLARMRDVGGDVNRITAFLQQATNLNAAELDTLFAAAATDNLLFARKFYDVRNIPFIPYAENRPLQRVVEAQTRITAGELSNISQTTVMAGGGIDRREQFQPISQAYHEIVDRAITAVSSGVTDYNAAVRDALSVMARSGIRTVEYQSGLKRRADSAVRMNILDGVRAVNQSVDQQIGAEIGADGIELSAHMTCAPDHLPMQGRQFANAEFARLQTGQACRDYQGHTYAGLKRPIGMWNCRHFARSIILGVSKPVYTDQQLQQLREDNEKKITIGGREYTAYEASQLMRKIETQIRAAKNEAVVFEITGDKAAAAGAHTKVLQLTATYEAVAKAANQRMKYARIRVPGAGPTQQQERTTVAGFRQVKTAAELSSKIPSASPRFVNKNDMLFKNAQQIKPIDGYEDVVVHADKFGFVFKDANGNESNVSVVEFAEILKNSGTYHGGNIRLIACESASDGAITAQALADILKVEIIAPNGVVYVHPDGKLTIGDMLTNQGEWVKIKPKE